MIEFRNVTILGLGLIGGSLALALKKSGYDGTITGFDIARENLEAATETGAIDRTAETVEGALEYGGLIVIAVPLGAYDGIFRQIAAVAGDRSLIITDVGSVKGRIHSLAEELLAPTVTFIGGHPMSGSEKGGFKAASATLFENAYYFLTPGKASPDIVEALKGLVRQVGAFPVVITPAEHDQIAAQISHAPHVLASLLANTLDAGNSVGHVAFAGGGFRDTTRIAAGDPLLWKDILTFNKKEVTAALAVVESMLSEIRSAIAGGKEKELIDFLQRAKFIRDSLPGHGRSYLPDFYNIIVDVEDKPGIIGRLTQLVGEKCLNIREIEVLHVREENAKGAIRIGFASEAEQKAAARLLAEYQFTITCS